MLVAVLRRVAAFAWDNPPLIAFLGPGAYRRRAWFAFVVAWLATAPRAQWGWGSPLSPRGRGVWGAFPPRLEAVLLTGWG